MPRYYFDIHDGERLTQGDDGQEFASREEMRDAAIRALPDIARDELPNSDVHVFSVRVRDEDGAYVFEATMVLRSGWVDHSERLDEDLEGLSREQLLDETRRLRAGIRAHRDSSGHALCWHHPQLWGLLPERIAPDVAVPPWPKFLRGCLRYRESLDRELPVAPIADVEFDPGS